jgi:hypothetical protein
MNASFLNLPKKRFTRGRVVPTISSRVSFSVRANLNWRESRYDICDDTNPPGKR